MNILRSILRGLVVAAMVALASAIALQYARIVHRNVVLAHALSTVQHDIVRLQTERERREATIGRLEDPQGAIPEIHDRLHQTLPNEAIIYVKGNKPQSSAQ